MAIPEGWELRTLGQLSLLITKGTTPTTYGHAYSEEGVPFFRVENITMQGSLELGTVKFISPATHELLARSKVRAGDLLFSIAGALGRVAMVPSDVIEANINQAIALIRIDPTHDCVGSYLTHSLMGDHVQAQVELEKSALAQANLNLKQVGDLSILLPPLPEQKKIAAILSSVDDTIAKTESVIAQLQIVKKAMKEQLLTKGMPGRHTRFKQTEIGEIPEEWEVVELSSVATVQTGIAKGKTVGEEAISVPYLRVANVQDGFIDLTEIKEIEVAPEQLPRFSLQTGDVLFCEGGDADKVGRGTVWLGQITPCLHQNHVFAVRPQLSKLLPEFLSLVRSGNSGRQYFLDSAKQTTNLASINSTQLKSFPTPLPSTEEQHEIVAAIASIVAALDKEQGVLSSYQSLKSALSSSLLSGEIRVASGVA
jgi:type I restriction enzyme S subunit